MKSRALNELRVARLRLRKALRDDLPALNRAAIAAAALIVTERERFPELGSGKGQKRFLFTTRDRERHLRRLEAISLVLMCLLSHMDLVTLRAGRRRRDGSCDAVRTLRPRTRKGRKAPNGRDGQTTIESETGLRSSSVERALRDLRSAGFITTHQPKKEYRDRADNKRWRSFPAVHTITRSCIVRLGIDLAWLDQQARDAQGRQEQGPAPIVDVREVRERQRIVRAQAMAAKRSGIESKRADQMVKRSAERVDRLFGKKRE